MYLRKSNSHGKTYLSFVQGYTDENGKVKQKTIKKIGFLEDLKKEYPDPIAYFKAFAKNYSSENITEYTLKNLNSQKVDINDKDKNLGYIFLRKIYNELNLNNLLKSKNKIYKVEYDFNSIFELLVYSRILFPASKNETYNNKDIYFDNFSFSSKDLYRSLDYLFQFKNDVLKTIWKNTKEKYNREIDLTYYDTTNYYFEISYNDEDLIDENGVILEKGYRKKGPSKEHRKTPIIQMGLLMDKNGLPLSYDLFAGDESEKIQMRPSLKKAKNDFNIERTIIVADRGQNTSDNTVFIAGKNDDVHTNHDGYVYGQSIIGANKEFKDWAISPEGFINDFIYDSDGNLVTFKEAIKDANGNILRYEDKPAIFKHKSRLYAKKVKIKKDNKRNVTYIVYQKQLVYYSKKYAERQKHERELAILKAKDLISNPGKYTHTTSFGCAKYINNLVFDKKTGEIIQNHILSLNFDKIKEEEKFDGFYSIVTSEKNLSDQQIRDIYKGLWKIEESFKITKSNLETRPVFVWTSEHIQSHFLTCFVSLMILRLLELKTNHLYSTNKLIDALKNFNCRKIEHDIYLNSYNSPIINDLSAIYNLDFSNKFLLLKKIKNFLK